MLAEGFLDEARRLRADPAWHPDLPAMRAVGYRQAWPCLDGEIDVATFRDRAVFATRQLAKRQITWLRSELDARWFDPDRGTLADDASRALALFGLGGDPSS
jgi:tRNA dimethylallyltransferase